MVLAAASALALGAFFLRSRAPAKRKKHPLFSHEQLRLPEYPEYSGVPDAVGKLQHCTSATATSPHRSFPMQVLVAGGSGGLGVHVIQVERGKTFKHDAKEWLCARA